MTPTTLIIIVWAMLPLRLEINYEDTGACYHAMDNFYIDFYSKRVRGVTLPAVELDCIKTSPKGEIDHGS